LWCEHDSPDPGLRQALADSRDACLEILAGHRSQAECAAGPHLAIVGVEHNDNLHTVLRGPGHEVRPQGPCRRRIQESSRSPLSDAVRFFHLDATSSAVGLKVGFDMVLLVIAGSLYRSLARRTSGNANADAHARRI
jgi:hypothetical protein